MSNTFTGKVSGRMSSRGWAIALGIGAVVLAAILLVVYLDRYRARVGGENAPTPVLVAKQLIPTGTPGSIVATNGMYAATTLPAKEVEVGAVADPSYLAGRAAAADIFPGQQITSTDFAASDTLSVDSQITGTQRAISISIDNVHGSLSQLQAGDSVDIYTSVSGRREALRAERQGPHHSGCPGTERRLEPGPANRDDRSLEVGLRRRQHAVLLRAPSGHRRQAHEESTQMQLRC